MTLNEAQAAIKKPLVFADPDQIEATEYLALHAKVCKAIDDGECDCPECQGSGRCPECDGSGVGLSKGSADNMTTEGLRRALHRWAPA